MLIIFVYDIEIIYNCNHGRNATILMIEMSNLKTLKSDFSNSADIMKIMNY